ncbi:oxidoreductase molybdopterin binding [Anaeromyxobacter dehalogenans 2CP-1]|uniref:Oxidoreductase molybdopterin binding n=1 Tax=Anaeromyxobacter dehalogenans (strain ATCC BAA-258 / DSM 21875 / 2CP-1) TaxID=455488 RepID=B8J5N4_ANAD2|nr:molybdopterin-dependent oxidoreductase [Anaeromyxobacter dehalogenans]ACL64981.1 oxidoreductase molybdopterin binding [Anaeromyxobacter dehalogenans 2CP-1]
MTGTRRAFLRAGLRTGALVALGGVACDSDHPRAGFLGLMERVNERLQRALFDPGRLAPELAESDESAPGDFPQYKIGSDYPAAPEGWALRVGGLVARPVVLSADALQRLQRTRTRVRHHCVEGWSAVASWDGVRVSELARLVAPDRRVRYVEFRSFEAGYYSSWDLESALHPQTILAYGMNGQPLAREYGAPLRLYSAVKLGYKMVKWVTDVSFLPVRTGGYWEDRGYEWFAGV